jgi:lipopolysaccharide export system permease protein
MKTLHVYLTRQVLATLVVTVAVFAFVLLLGNVLKEILMMLVNRQATLGLVVQAVALLIPFVLVFALPMGMLTATLLAFGRFSADQELTAARSNGISLLTLAMPILLLSVALSGVCAAFNMKLGPECRVAYKGLLLQYGTRQPTSIITEGRFITDFPGYIIYVNKVKGNQLDDVLFCRTENGQIVQRIRADSGQLVQGDNAKQFFLHLTNISMTMYLPDKQEWIPTSADENTVTVDFNQTNQSSDRLNYSDMTFSQLVAEKRQLEKLLMEPPVKGGAKGEDLHKENKRVSTMKEDTLMPITVQMNQQVAFSFACIGFTLVGIPLGIRAHRRETSAGIGMALVLVLVYYSFLILAQSLQTRAEYAPQLIVWLPNFIFQAAGAVLLWRANRGI